MQAGEFFKGRVPADLALVRRSFDVASAETELRNPHLETPVAEQVKSAARRSSVLIPILNAAEPQVLVTKRQADIRFGGHLCFPGGGREGHESEITTALRETNEEINLDPEDVEVLGIFGHYYTQAGFRIAAVVGLVDQAASFAPNPDEVASIHTIPLENMLDGSNYELVYRTRDRGHIHFRDKDLQIGGPTVSLMIGLLEWLASLNPTVTLG